MGLPMTPDRSTLDALATKLAVATGPDRDLDAEIAVAFDKRPDCAPKGGAMFKVADGYLFIPQSSFDDVSLMEKWCPDEFTGSLDAAVALIEAVLPGACWGMSTWHEGRPISRVVSPRRPDGVFRTQEVFAATPAIALCRALVELRLAMEEPDR
jgi:hypothetical protein